MNTDIIPEFYLPTEIYIKQDILNHLGVILSRYGQRAILITVPQDLEKYHGTIETVAASMSKSDIGMIIYDEMTDSPNTEFADSAAYFAKKTGCDIIVGFGSIESLNLAKSVSILVNNHLFCEDLFENPEVIPPVPLVTIPAYPVVGFEILPMFYLSEIHEMVHKVYYNTMLYPKATIIDPATSLEIGDEMTSYSGLATLAIATESIISKQTNGMINTYALRAIDLIFKNLPLAYKEESNISARFQLSTASVMAGIAFSVANLSISLALSLALSSRTALDIMKSMSVILPHVMEYNLTASPGKYVQMSKVMDEDVKDITVIEAAIKAVEGVRKLGLDIDAPQRLSSFDIEKKEFAAVADIAVTYPFLENAPRTLNRDEIETILIASY